MMRSMYSAVSGLRVHQGKMDTIGNNIANVNTIGFKKGQVTFQEVFSQVTRGASAPQGGKGGTNPQQIGMGTAVGSINTIHTTGAGQRTDNPTDLMIGGEGFFVVADDTGFNNKFYTRAGNFSLDRDGNLVTADGFRVLGYPVDEKGEPRTSEITNVRINKSETVAPKETDKIVMEGNLDGRIKKGGKAHTADTTITDSLGNSYKVTFKYEKTDDYVAPTNPDGTGGTPDTWKMTVDRVTDMSTGNYLQAIEAKDAVPAVPIGGLLNADNTVALTFDSNGKLQNPAEVKLSSAGLSKLKFDMNKDDKKIPPAVGGPTSPSGTFSDITIFDPEDPDTTKFITQYSNDMNLKPQAKTGNTSGVLEGFTIDATGTVVGVFTNGERKPLAQIMIAKFDNPMGLQKAGSNFFLDTRNSGEAQFGQAGASGYGPIEGGVLEMSNVDISLEFTEMITTQRGFQANSRIITTSDEMLQELVNMKR